VVHQQEELVLPKCKQGLPNDDEGTHRATDDASHPTAHGVVALRL